MDASIIFINGNIVTMDNGMIAEALAVENERILYVGDNSQAMKYLSVDTCVVNLKGKTITPVYNRTNPLGFIDDILREAAESNKDNRIYELLESMTLKASRDKKTGMIREGYLADIVVLDSNPLVLSFEMLESINLESVYIDGSLVYEATKREI
ncbi:Amidohydrolase family protein [Dethiosulfatibacter aminovorans DSM 17477]|uniref:Amidohydrolase family protein n=2 Tax=Dethiosulfatibacter TaxID=448125 RepID=A0A1M6HVB1_9FIRM|nr:amidohydrolase family protein [Dethiosulfatibacter aminovorans]SHJ26130.1 Amidohydrolase family protein [Dethiosulfatibacter aminovorans DSM 17477]